MDKRPSLRAQNQIHEIKEGPRHDSAGQNNQPDEQEGTARFHCLAALQLVGRVIPEQEAEKRLNALPDQ